MTRQTASPGLWLFASCVATAPVAESVAFTADQVGTPPVGRITGGTVVDDCRYGGTPQ